jgi:hypothetical protein
MCPIIPVMANAMIGSAMGKPTPTRIELATTPALTRASTWA